MRACLFALFVAAIGAAACAQTIEGPAEIEAGQPTWYSITNVPDGTYAVWVPSSTGSVTLQAGLPYVRDSHALLFATQSGKTTIVAVVALTDEAGRLKGLVPISKEIEVTGEAPPPDPFHNPYPVPSENWKEAVTAILKSKPPRDYAVDRAARFSRFAKSVRLKDVSSVRELWELMAAEKAEGTWPAAKTAVAGVLQSHLGRSDTPLEPIEAEKMLSAIAWALVEASK